MTKFRLTSKAQHSVKCKDGKTRGFLLYFLNNVLILKQKLPFEKNIDSGWQHQTKIYGEYLLGGRLYQYREKRSIRKRGEELIKRETVRFVSWPISSKILKSLEVPSTEKIGINYNLSYR